MVTEGTYEVDVLPDKWTAVTRDHKYAAHFEHSIAVTKNGPEILSIGDRGLVPLQAAVPPESVLGYIQFPVFLIEADCAGSCPA